MDERAVYCPFAFLVSRTRIISLEFQPAFPPLLSTHPAVAPSPFILPRYPIFLVGLFACAFPLFNSLFAVHIYLSIKGTLHDYRPFFGRHIFLLRMRAGESSVMQDLRGSFKNMCHFTKTLSQMIIEEFCRLEGKHIEISIINRQVLSFYLSLYLFFQLQSDYFRIMKLFLIKLYLFLQYYNILQKYRITDIRL